MTSYYVSPGYWANGYAAIQMDPVLPLYSLPTTVQEIIPSYLYWEYNDDEDLQAFVDSYNSISQKYLNTFNQLNLPVYTGNLISGKLLDWVALGIYGQIRPSLPSGRTLAKGTYNTLEYNELEYNGYERSQITSFYETTDDIFKRILTWNLYKGDGRIFNVRWLKRRVMRFLTGANGIDPGINQTYQVSVTFGFPNIVNIRILSVIRTITGGTYGSVLYNSNAYNYGSSVSQEFPSFEYAPILKSAIDSGVLQLPFQYTYNVII